MLRAYSDAIKSTLDSINAATNGAVVRIFIPQLYKISSLLDLRSSEHCRAVAAHLLRLKYLARDTASLLTLTYLPDVFPHALTDYIKAFADNNFGVESFAGTADAVPYEFKEFHGLLSIKRVQAIGVLAPFRPQGHKYGLKRDRRKLGIEPLHLPPEESRAVAPPEAGSKGVALSAGSACSTRSGSSGTSLDF